MGLPEQQTTSQPTLIARMIDVAEPRMNDRVLEVGTGFGFQTALLAQLVAYVVSIDRHRSLTNAAASNLARAGVSDVVLLTGDGWEGASEYAPFDVIIVAAAAPEVPPALGAQLAEGGRLVIPVSSFAGDEVLLFGKQAGVLQRKRLVTPARFVPLVQERSRRRPDSGNGP